MINFKEEIEKLEKEYELIQKSCSQLIDEVVKNNNLIEKLGNTLNKASNHLNYCGYGDSYERDCAIIAKLDIQIENALEEYNKWKEDK